MLDADEVDASAEAFGKASFAAAGSDLRDWNGVESLKPGAGHCEWRSALVG